MVVVKVGSKARKGKAPCLHQGRAAQPSAAVDTTEDLSFRATVYFSSRSFLRTSLFLFGMSTYQARTRILQVTTTRNTSYKHRASHSAVHSAAIRPQSLYRISTIFALLSGPFVKTIVRIPSAIEALMPFSASTHDGRSMLRLNFPTRRSFKMTPLFSFFSLLL